MKSIPLSALYHPITAAPFLGSGAYQEIPPCGALKPYIRCFWGTPLPQSSSETAGRPAIPDTVIPDTVIPDTCMDIIVRVDPSDHTVTAGFCAMDERTYQAGGAESGAGLSTFGIRFFGWSAVLFSTEGFRHTRNRVFDPDEFFRGITGELTEIVRRFLTLTERAGAAEKILLRRLNPSRQNSDLMNAVSDMILYQGRMKISEIARRNALSERNMERIFSENIGVSPKTLSNLIRYQLVWQEVARGGTDILDMVEKYGYTDQAHLLNDFRFRHGMTPAQALQNARLGTVCFEKDKN